jgi:thioredoxin-related protein
MRGVRAVVIACLGLWLAGSALAAGPERVPVEGFFNQSFGDFQEELANAREQGKQGILIMFEMDECPFCHRMKATVLNRADVQEYFQANFMVFSVDIEGDIEVVDFQGNPTTMKDFAFQQYRVRATPVFQFFDLDGQPIKGGRYTGATRDAEEFLLLGRFVAEGHYRDSNFTKFKRAQKSAPGAS